MPHDRKSLLHVIYLSTEIFSGTEEHELHAISFIMEGAIAEARVMAQKRRIIHNERARDSRFFMQTFQLTNCYWKWRKSSCRRIFVRTGAKYYRIGTMKGEFRIWWRIYSVSKHKWIAILAYSLVPISSAYCICFVTMQQAI